MQHGSVMVTDLSALSVHSIVASAWERSKEDRACQFLFLPAYLSAACMPAYLLKSQVLVDILALLRTRLQGR